MKVSVSLPDGDVKYLDQYATSHGLPSRAAVLQKALRLLRASELDAAYEDAWAEWESSGEGDAWDVLTGDGLTDATR